MAKVKRQPKLPGTNSDADKELEDCAEALAKANEAISAAKKEREDAAIAAMEVMKRKKKTTYTTETLRPAYTMTIKAPGEAKIAIREASVIADDDEGGDE
jgi:uncharacterized membrane-anchored protein